MDEDLIALFQSQVLYEAPEDTPPDVAANNADDSTPDVPDDAADQDAGPPDVPDDTGGDDLGGMDDGGPPDIGDDFGGDDDSGFEDDDGGGDGNQQNDQDLGLDQKVSAIMNMNLYQRYLTLLSTINSQLTLIRNNSDMLYTLSANSLEIVESLKKLDENIRLYINNSFMNENYSKNLLFFNKCMNLLKLLNDSFDRNVRAGIKDM